MIKPFPILIIFLLSCTPSGKEKLFFEKAVDNAQTANEGFKRCQRYASDWLTYADETTGLIPRNLYGSSNIWNAKDAAADNYPFMVLTTALTDREMFNNRMKDMLRSEIEHTSRLYSLPDTYSFVEQDFTNEKIDTASLIFGASEYVKDGLLPLTEWLGPSPWSERMINLIDDIWHIAPVSTRFGVIPSTDPEINGEMMQALSRLYWMTGDEKYLDWAIRLGDYYLLGDHHPTDDFTRLRLRDHGCEIVSGLCEVYTAVNYTRPEKKEAYRDPLHRMLDRVLEVGRNEDGMFYNNINPQTGEPENTGVESGTVADTWGYTYNGFYTVFLIDRKEAYREAVVNVLNNLDKYENYDWETGSADGYADAIESALNLYNRERGDMAENWIDSQTEIMWSMQDSSHREGALKWKNRGIIEGWHGDGNFARTTIMYCLWKTQGLHMFPWRPDLQYGAENDDGILRIAVIIEKPWKGSIRFDRERHRKFLNLPLDYPRINQFPEWYTVEDNKKYTIYNHTTTKENVYSGYELIEGIDLNLNKTGTYYFELREL